MSFPVCNKQRTRVIIFCFQKKLDLAELSVYFSNYSLNTNLVLCLKEKIVAPCLKSLVITGVDAHQKSLNKHGYAERDRVVG